MDLDPSGLAIIHFQPLEKYPPVMNMINYLAENKIYPVVYTNETTSLDFRFVNSACVIKRFGDLGKASRFSRSFGYFRFIVGTTWQLWRTKGPLTILYYESLSALPALVIKFLRPETRVMVHYHEYTTPEEYRGGMLLSNLSLGLEKKWFSRYAWVSHTNRKRLEMFIGDFSLPGQLNYQVLPNYPPSKWSRFQHEKPVEIVVPVRLVYCGALGMKSTFLVEVCQWVKAQNGKVLLDIYSHQLESEVSEFLENIDCSWITFKGNVGYFDLPEVLAKYEIGLILYKGLTKNYVYNAPNKLFEYLSVGLDVWFPVEMEGCYPYVTDGTYPRVVKVNFKELSSLDLVKTIDHSNLKRVKTEFFCEQEYVKVKEALQQT